MSFLFPLLDFSTPSPFFGQGIPALVNPSSASGATTSTALPDGSPVLGARFDAPSTSFAPTAVDPSFHLPGIPSGSVAPAVSTSFFPSPLTFNSAVPDSSSSPAGAPPLGAFATGAPGVSSVYPSVSPLPSSSVSPSTALPSTPPFSHSRSRSSPLKVAVTPTPSPRHTPAPKRPSKPKSTTKSSNSSSSSRGVITVKQIYSGSVFLRDLPLELLTFAGLRTLLIGHKVSGRSACRTRIGCIALLQAHVCNYECESLTYEVEHLVSDVSPDQQPSDDDVKKAVAELMNKHLKSGENFPPCISRKIKENVIDKWLDHFSNQSMTMTVCSVCSERMLESQTKLRSLTPDVLRLLRNPSLPPGLHPKGYDFDLLEEAILDHQGIVETPEGNRKFVVCDSCWGFLHKNKLPPLSLANDNYLGFDCVPDDIRKLFETATPVELSLVSRYRVRCTVHKYSSKTKSSAPSDTGGGPSYAPSQSYMLGNTITFANECSSLLSVLPPPADVLGETICVMFVGSVYPSPEEIQKMTPLLARRNVVWSLLSWLKENHSGYKDVVLSPRNLDAVLPNESPSIPNGVFISHLPSNARETESSGYTNDRDETPEGPEIPTAANGVISQSIEGMTIRENKALAIKHWKTGGGAFTVPHGSNPINEYDNPKLFPCMFPHLFPWGIGGFEDGNRRVSVSMESHVKHLLNLSDVRPQLDRNFSFVAMNILQRRKTSQASRFKVKATHYDRAAELLCSAEASACESIISRSKANRGYVAPETKAEKELFELMEKVNIMSSNVPGSNASKVKMRNEIRALIHWLGTPSLFITLNPADLHSPIFCHFAGAKVDLDSTCPDLPSGFERLSLLARNPAAAARFFNAIMRAFIDVVLDMDSPEGGLFGRIAGYYGSIEAQGRGSLHCHMLIWISGSLGPDALRAKMTEDENFRESLFSWLNDTIKTEVPGHPYDENVTMDNQEFDKRPEGDRHPSTCRCPRPKNPGMPDAVFETEFERQLYRLVLDCNWHFHRDTCWKYLRPGEPKEHEHCRMRKDGSKRANPELEVDTGAILHRQTHPRINAYHDILIMLLNSNIDISFIGSGPAAKALIYYITDYITKSGLPTHVAFSALQVVIQKVKVASQEAEESESADAVLNADKQGRQLLTKACNALIGQQELSGQQVAMHLLGLADGDGDHYTSHEFRTLHWAAFRGWLRNELKENTASPAPADGSALVADALLLPDQADADASKSDLPENVVHEEIDEDEVLLDLSKEGRLSLAHSQLKDYRFRGDGLSNMGLYWFVALTERITFKSEETRASSKNQTGIAGNAGVKPMPRILFRREHPYTKTHLLRLRRSAIVPVIVGPSLASKSVDYERHCCDMLVLFKPWRTLADLRSPGESWAQAFEAASFDNASLERISNMNHLHECKDAKDAYNELRRKGVQKHNLIDDRMLSAHPAVRDSFETPSIDEESEVLNVIREFAPHLLEPSRKCDDNKLTRDERRALAAEEAVVIASRVGLNELDEDSDDDMRVDDAAPIGSTQGVELGAMKQLMTAYKEKLDAESVTVPGSDSTPDADEPQDSRIATVNDLHIEPKSSLIHDDNPGFSEDAEGLVNSVVSEFSLNEQQERAMKVIAYHKISGIDAQLMMIVAGPGGTGKSRIIAAVSDLFEKLNVSNSLKKAAPTGIAAYAIKGTTIHSLLGLVGRGKSFSRKALERAQNRLAGVTDIFVDEFSMVGADFFSLMSTRLGEVRGNDKPFGGINMTFFGDPRQLPPVGDSALWRPIPLPQPEGTIQDRNAKMAGSARGQRTAHGQGLWAQIEEVVLLTENHRAALDKKYVDMVERIARGRGTEADRQAFLTREITTAKFDRKEWADAPLVTADKVMRDRWNLEAVRSHANRTQRDLHDYVAADQMSAESVKGPLRDVLLSYPSSTKTHDRLGKLPLVVGMRVMILHNILTSVGVVNGAEGTIERILYDESLSGDRIATVVFVKVEGAVVDIPGLEPGVVPVFPDTVSMTLPLKNQRSITVSRTQLPILPAYAFTDYKSQARTLKHVVLDVASAASLESAYVMVSRAVGLKNILLLRPFPLSKIERQQSPGVFAEMSRLKTLDNLSQVRFSQNEALRKARMTAMRTQRPIRKSAVGSNPNPTSPPL